MKKFLRSVVVLLFCLTLITSTATVSLAAGKVTGAKVSAVTYNSATLTWKKVKGADGYQVRYYADKKYSKTVDVKKKTTYKFKLTPGKSYSLEARAYEKKLKRFKTVYEYGSWAKVKVKAVPAQVKNLKGKQSGNSVKLTWSKTSDVTGYNVQQYVKKKWKTIATTTKNTYTVKKQKYQTTQQFRVSAYKTYKKKNYTGSYSSTVKVTLATPAPAKVASLKATQSNTSAKLSWKKIDGVKGYQVQQYVSKKWKTIKTVTANSYTVTGLKWQSSHQFRVRAYKQYDDIKVYGAYSSTAKLTIATPAPAQVTSLKATQSSTSAKLSWAAVSGASGYTVQQYKSGKWATIKTLTANSLTVTGLSWQSSYQFRVCAFKNYGDIKVSGAYSATAKVTIATPAPAAVTGFKASQSANSAKLTWTAVSGASGYNVQQYKSSKWETIKSVTTNSYTVPSLTYGSTYKFRVCAYKTYGTIKSASAYTAEASVTIATAKPSSFKLSTVATTSAKLTWGAVTGAKGYEVYNYSTGKTVTVTTNSFSISGLKAGTAYKFKVRSYAGSYKSAYTSDLSFITVPAKVTSLKAADVLDTTANVSWAKSNGCTAYQLQRYDEAAKKWVSTCSDTSATSVAITTLKPNATNKLRVRGYLKDGSTTRYSEWSSEISVKTMLQRVTIKSANNDASQLNLSWNAVDGAAEYILEYYDIETYSWKNVNEGTENKITQTSYTMTTSARVSKLVRAYALDANGNKGVISKGTTVTPTPISITNNALSAKVTWGDIENTTVKQGETVKLDIEKYIIYAKPLNANSGATGWRTQEIFTVSDLDSYTLSLTPGTVNAYQIYAIPKNASSYRIAMFAIDAADLTIDNTDAGKNAQLLYLVNAINKTKAEQGTVTAAVNSVTNMNCDVLKFGGPLAGMLSLSKPSLWSYWSTKEDAFILDSPEKITKFMKVLDEEASADDFNTSETVNESHTFTNGIVTLSNGKSLKLNSFIEPSGAFATLYNMNKPAAWKNGFSAVNTVKNADGTYTITATLKAESYGDGTGKTKTVYHSGFSASFDSLNFGDALGDFGEGTSTATVGSTSITAKITADGRLISYSMTSPVSMFMDTTMNITEDGDTKALTLESKMSGKITMNYTFTR